MNHFSASPMGYSSTTTSLDVEGVLVSSSVNATSSFETGQQRESHALFLDDLEVEKKYDDPERAIRAGAHLVKYEPEVLLEHLQHEEKRITRFLEEGAPEISRPLLKTRLTYVQRLKKKMTVKLKLAEENA